MNAASIAQSPGPGATYISMLKNIVSRAKVPTGDGPGYNLTNIDPGGTRASMPIVLNNRYFVRSARVLAHMMAKTEHRESLRQNQVKMENRQEGHKVYRQIAKPLAKTAGSTVDVSK